MTDKESLWVKVQIKAFTAWVNSYLEKVGCKIEDLSNDISNGVLLCRFLEVLSGKTIKFTKEPKMRTHEFENVTIALDFMKTNLGINLVGIGSGDIVDKNLKLILGLLWAVFRKQTTVGGGGGGSESEANQRLLQWLAEQTEGYDGVEIKTFKHSFHDGLAFSALIHRFDNTLIDFDSLTPSEREANLNRAFELAEQHLKIPKLLEASDLMEGNADERSVVLYCSLFFHAFQTNADLLANQKTANEEKTALKSKIQQAEEEITKARTRVSELETESSNLQAELDKTKTDLSTLEDKHKNLENELDETRKNLRGERERNKKILEDQVKQLDQLLEDNKKAQEESELQLKKFIGELESMQQEKDQLKDDLDKTKGELSDTKSELESQKKRRKKMEHEIEDLQKKMAKETSRRRQKAQALAELQAEIQNLKRKALIEGKARRGLDILKKNLEEHLEDMYQWRDLHQVDTDAKDRLEFDLQKVLAETANKSFEDQLDILNDKLQAENVNLTRIIRLSDNKIELKEVVEKSGWLYMKASKKQKEWKKQFFVLKGPNLLYFKDEKGDKPLGEIKLAECHMIALKAEKIETDPASGPAPAGVPKKIFITRVAVEEKSVYLGFTSLKEKSSWMLPLRSKMQHFAYLKACETGNYRLDTRILALFSATDLKACYLDHNPIPTCGVDAITSILTLHDALDTLHMCNSSLGDSEIKPLIEALPKWKLKILDLGNNKLTSAGCTEVVKALAQQPNEFLTELRLNDNEIDDAGVIAIAECLENLPKLKVLTLTGNKFGDKGISAYASALAKGENVIPILAVSSNNISDEGAQALAKMLGKAPNVTRLELAGNEISDAGAVALCGALTDNGNIEEIDLSLNSVGPKGALACRSLLNDNKTLQVVNLSHNRSLVGGEDTKDLLALQGFHFPDLKFTRLV